MLVSNANFIDILKSGNLTSAVRGTPVLGSYPVNYQIKKNMVIFHARGLLKEYTTYLSVRKGMQWVSAVTEYEGDDLVVVDFLESSMNYRKVIPTKQQIAFYRFWTGKTNGYIHAFEKDGVTYLTEHFSKDVLPKTSWRMFESG